MAKEWLDERDLVVARMETRSMQGKGMKIIRPQANLPRCPLYTLFFPHEAEVRVHVAFGNAIELHDKTAAGFNGTNTGRKYQIDDVAQTMLSSIAEKTIEALDLDFGAVDLLWDAANKSYVVLEVNTAPAMQDGTLEKYETAFKANLDL